MPFDLCTDFIPDSYVFLSLFPSFRGSYALVE